METRETENDLTPPQVQVQDNEFQHNKTHSTLSQVMDTRSDEPISDHTLPKSINLSSSIGVDNEVASAITNFLNGDDELSPREKSQVYGLYMAEIDSTKRSDFNKGERRAPPRSVDSREENERNGNFIHQTCHGTTST